MVVWALAKRPMILAIGVLDRKIVDACIPGPHQAVIVELPILVSIGSVPVSRVVTEFICKTD
jgi:hypothetical protein